VKAALVITTLVLMLICSIAMADVPPMINYQGKLLQPSGAPVADGTYQMTFAIYGAPTGGTALWSETNPSVQVKGGLFATVLGSVVSLPSSVFGNTTLYFGVQVGSDPEMTPRQQMVSSAFAFRSSVAGTVDDGAITTSKIAANAVTANNIANGAVGMAQLAAGAVSNANELSYCTWPNNNVTYPSLNTWVTVPTTLLSFQTSGGNVLLMASVEVQGQGGTAAGSAINTTFDFDGGWIGPSMVTAAQCTAATTTINFSLFKLMTNVPAGNHTVQLMSSASAGPTPVTWDYIGVLECIELKR